MIVSLLEFSLRQRILVIGLACLLSVIGVIAFESIPIDAYPDVTNIQVQVLTDAPGLSPVEVERFITYPLEIQMTGLPGLAEIRSLSKFALSQITVVFNDDVDIYFARQLVFERIMAAKERLPDGLEPIMAPVSTGLGEVYQYYVEGSPTLQPAQDGQLRGRPEPILADTQVLEKELTDQRTIQDWVLRPLLSIRSLSIRPNCENSTSRCTRSTRLSRRIMPMPAGMCSSDMPNVRSFEGWA
jgi:cobalt-zinc-cadmium resistance protein CzcA